MTSRRAFLSLAGVSSLTLALPAARSILRGRPAFEALVGQRFAVAGAGSAVLIAVEPGPFCATADNFRLRFATMRRLPEGAYQMHHHAVGSQALHLQPGQGDTSVACFATLRA